nr:uncharacterized protein LOC115840161 [Globicephala melas]
MLLVSEGEKENTDLYGGAGIPAFEEEAFVPAHAWEPASPGRSASSECVLLVWTGLGATGGGGGHSSAGAKELSSLLPRPRRHRRGSLGLSSGLAPPRLWNPPQFCVWARPPALLGWICRRLPAQLCQSGYGGAGLGASSAAQDGSAGVLRCLRLGGQTQPGSRHVSREIPASIHHPSFLHHPPLWSFCPQGRNCSAWGPSVSCFRNFKFEEHISSFHTVGYKRLAEVSFAAVIIIEPVGGMA